MGGSRIIQAIARDRIFPFIEILGRGYGKGDEPRPAVIVTACIAQLCLFIGGNQTSESIFLLMTIVF